MGPGRQEPDVFSEWVYCRLLLVYPREHRREYEEPMIQLFRDRMRRDGGGCVDGRRRSR